MEKFSKIFAGSMTILFVIALILFVWIWPCGAKAQDGMRLQRHKLYDTTKVNSKRLTADIDSSGITLYAWGDECHFKINLLQRMLINANFYETGERNGHPYLKYGNNNFRFRMYINKGGNFEFDAEIRNKSPKGRHEFPFNIQTKNLDFFFQGELTQENIDDGFVRPDSVVNSYAVYHSTKMNNKYKTGKAFHIYRPKAWDNAGDTVWGYININTELGRMKIGVDSTWMANAVYPVTIDPRFGNESAGATGQTITANADLFYWQISTDSSFGMSETSILDSMVFYAEGHPSSFPYMLGGLYDDNSGTPDNMLASVSQADSVIIDGGATAQWYQMPISGTITEQTVWTVLARSVTGGGDLLIYTDNVTTGDLWDKEGQTAVWPNFDDPVTITPRVDHYRMSIYFEYHTDGAPEPIMRRRRNR